jgi:DNA-binding transcriptional regulator YiaG
VARINRAKVMPAHEMRNFRARNHMSQRELAEILGVDSRTISKWENMETTIPPHMPLALEAIERRQADKREAQAREAMSA